MYTHNKKLTPYAKKLRKDMTRQERHLWYDYLRNYPVRFLRQKVIKNYIVDFYCATAKLVVEIDGGQHYTEEALCYDALRSKEMNELGLTVLRFTNIDIDKNFEGVCSEINRVVSSRL